MFLLQCSFTPLTNTPTNLNLYRSIKFFHYLVYSGSLGYVREYDPSHTSWPSAFRLESESSVWCYGVFHAVSQPSYTDDVSPSFFLWLNIPTSFHLFSCIPVSEEPFDFISCGLHIIAHLSSAILPSCSLAYCIKILAAIEFYSVISFLIWG